MYVHYQPVHYPAAPTHTLSALDLPVYPHPRKELYTFCTMLLVAAVLVAACCAAPVRLSDDVISQHYVPTPQGYVLRHCVNEVGGRSIVRVDDF